MPTQPRNGFPAPDFDPDNNIVPLRLEDDDALWQLLNTYADGEATNEEVVQVEALLRSHSGVAREFAFLQLTSHSVREFTEVDPPAAMTNMIFAATSQRTTLYQRVRTWCSSGGGSFGLASFRLGGAALASGVLAVVLWSRYNSRPVVFNGPASTVAAQTPSKVARLSRTHPFSSKVAANESIHTRRLTVAHSEAPSIVPVSADTVAAIALARSGSRVNLPGAGIVRTIAASPISPSDRSLRSTHEQPVQATYAVVEERHMASDTSAGAKAAKQDDLGPDVEARADVPSAEVAAATPVAKSDEPPTTVATVSYKPGSISEKTRNAPPAVQSLYMRTQEAIRRQHELQQYGGYSREAYNNVQRGEVGLSLVGGRF